MSHEELLQDLISLEQSGAITEPERNLRSKIDSILRSLENLSAKKVRIEFEIRRQKKSLERKREELRKVSKRSTSKLKISLEQQTPIDQFFTELGRPSLQRLDSILLQKSNDILEAND